MDLKMRVFTQEFDSAGLLEAFDSVIVSDKAFGAGNFKIRALITSENLRLLRKNHIIWIDEESAGVIEKIEMESGENGLYISIGGYLLTGILSRRILWGLYDLTGTPQAIMRYLVNECAINPTRGDVPEARKIPRLVLADGFVNIGEKIRIQRTGDNLLEVLEELGTTYHIAFGVRFNPETLQMEFWTRPGVDRTVQQQKVNPVFFSTDLDDINQSEYSYNSINYKNIALVAGEGEGKDRKYVVVQGEILDVCVVGYGHIGKARIGRSTE